MPIPLAKKTKAELLEEYAKLVEQHEELRRTAQLVSDPQSVALMSKVESYTADQLTTSIAELKTSVNGTLNELAEKLIAEAQKFSELQKSIDLSKKNLELHYNVQIGAETLDRLIADHKMEMATFEEGIGSKKRDWTRTQEEHEYMMQLKKRRAEEEFEELKTKNERDLRAQQEALALRGNEIQELRAQVDRFPAELELKLKEREREVAASMKAEWDAQFLNAKKDWESQKNLYELRVATFEERIKAHLLENASVKQELERANKRVQELATKIIESGAPRNVAKEPEGAERAAPQVKF